MYICCSTVCRIAEVVSYAVHYIIPSTSHFNLRYSAGFLDWKLLQRRFWDWTSVQFLKSRGSLNGRCCRRYTYCIATICHLAELKQDSIATSKLADLLRCLRSLISDIPKLLAGCRDSCIWCRCDHYWLLLVIVGRRCDHRWLLVVVDSDENKMATGLVEDVHHLTLSIQHFIGEFDFLGKLVFFLVFFRIRAQGKKGKLIFDRKAKFGKIDEFFCRH